MCGIAGFVSQNENVDVQAARLLCAGLKRRGPDGEWHVRRGGYDLVQTRLAVVDLSQELSYPIPNEHEDIWLLFNGEIYDHRLVRRELEGRGHRFRTGCDAEVVVHAYEEWGDQAFSRMNGMFALAIIDETKNELVLARDQFGIKPLVRTAGGRFAFSSDAMTLVAAGLVSGEVDLDAVAEYTAFHYVPPPLTGLLGLEQIPAGTAVHRHADGTERSVHFGFNAFERPPPLAEIDEEVLDAALQGAVRRQLQADVKVGVLLSSGVDSALLLSYAVEANARPRAYTLAFADYGDYDESPGAARLAAALGVEHEMETLSLGFSEAATTVGDAFDQPFADSSAIATIQLAGLAKTGSTVVLTGTGSDELFAGYYRVRAHRLRRISAALRAFAPRGYVVRAQHHGAERASLSMLARSYAKRLMEADLDGDLEQYLSLTANATSEAGCRHLLKGSANRLARERVASRLMPSEPTGAPMQDLQAFELRTFLEGDVLMKEDRATMSVGLEGRVPFLDAAVARIAAEVPVAQRASAIQGKKILRSIAKRRLGQVGIPLTKRGFAVPLDALFRSQWRSESIEWFEDASSELVDTAAVASDISQGQPAATDVWAHAALVAWETRINAARKTAASSTGV